MTFINRAEVSSAGVLGDSVALPAESAGVLGGINYVSAASGTLSATGNDPAGPNDGAYVDAFRFNSQGQMFVWNFDSRGAPPGGVFYTGGLPFTKDGQLVVTASPVAWYCAGWPLALNNFVVGVPTGGGSLPGAFTFNVFQLAENVQIGWSAATGASVYEIRRDGVLIATVNAPTTNYADLINFIGGSVSYTMAAINGTGTTQSSSNPQLITVLTVPGQPAAPVATAGNTTASLAFTPPAKDGGSAITSYRFTASPGGAQQTTSAPSPYVFTGLTNGTLYTFTVLAINAQGLGAQSPASNPVTPASTGAVAIFTAPLTNTMIPTLATGSPTPAFTRATQTYVPNNGGDLYYRNAGEIGFWGARKVRNSITDSEYPFNPSTLTGIAPISGPVTDPLGGNTAGTLTATAPNGTFVSGNAPTLYWNKFASAWIRRRTGTGTVTLSCQSAAAVDITPQLTGAWKRFAASNLLGTTSGQLNITIATSGDAVDIAFIQLDIASPNIIQQPSEYVRSTSSETPPYDGCGVAGVKCFTTVNGNTVGANGVMTEAVGAPISPSILKGAFLEGQRTNLVLWSFFLTNAAWIKTNATAVFGAGTPAPDGGSNCSSLTADAANGTATIAATTTPGQPYACSIYLKRLIGTGAVEFTVDGTTWTPVTGQVNANWNRIIAQVASAGATITIGVRLGTSGDAVGVWDAQVENGTFPTSPIDTAGAAGSRVNDVLTYDLAANLLPTVGSVSAEGTCSAPPTDASNRGVVTIEPNSSRPLAVQTPGQMNIYDGTTNISTANAYSQNTAFKAASRWGAAGSLMGVILNAGAIANTDFDGAMDGTTISVGLRNSLPNLAFFGGIKNLNIYSTPLSDAEMVAKTT